MKKLFLILILFIGIFSSFFCFSHPKSLPSKAKNHALSKKAQVIDPKYIEMFKELSWVSNEKAEVINTKLNFMYALMEGKYIDYLSLMIHQDFMRRVSYEQFVSLKKKLRTASKKLVFSYEEFCSCLVYALSLSEICDSKEYTSISWTYGVHSLLECLSFHPDVFPTSKNFSALQMELVKEIIRILQEKQFFSLDKNIGSFLCMDDSKSPVCKEAIEPAFFVYAAKMAGTYIDMDKTKMVLSSGYLRSLTSLEKEINSLLQ